MSDKQWYEKLFANYAKKYDQEVFTQGTIGECDFIERELSHNKSLRILDVGCGTGRHAIELTRRGYAVVGIDFSAAQIARAREKAAEAKLDIAFHVQDARDLKFEDEFDAVIMICEGGFSLMETDEMNFQILESATRSLRPGGKFIFTALNALFPLYHSVEAALAVNKEEGNATYRSNSFDLMTFRDHSVTEIEDDAGKKVSVQSNERYYVPSEVTWLLKSLGYAQIEVFGAKLGAFSRDDRLTTEDYELLVVAEL